MNIPNPPKSFYDVKAFDNGELLYHIKLKKGDVGKYVLLPGDPKRVGLIAKHLDDAKLIADYREYVTATGYYKGVKVSVTSTGIGGPSATIAMEELIKVGADTFIRVGTAGGLRLDVEAGDLAIANAAIRDEGTSSEYIPEEYPAIANYDVVLALRDAANSLGCKNHVGVVHSKDCFYGELEPESAMYRERFENNLKYYTKCGAVASEMEAAALFACASVRRVRAAGIMYVVENTMLERMGTRKPNPNKIDDMFITALEACVLLEKRGK